MTKEERINAGWRVVSVYYRIPGDPRLTAYVSRVAAGIDLVYARKAGQAAKVVKHTVWSRSRGNGHQSGIARGKRACKEDALRIVRRWASEHDTPGLEREAELLSRLLYELEEEL